MRGKKDLKQVLIKGGVGCVPVLGPLLAELAGLADSSDKELVKALKVLESKQLEFQDRQRVFQEAQSEVTVLPYRSTKARL